MREDRRLDNKDEPVKNINVKVDISTLRDGNDGPVIMSTDDGIEGRQRIIEVWAKYSDFLDEGQNKGSQSNTDETA